ncbi:MAG: hypothetical protein GKR92_06935 [Gammaproteobacteria bacterium]|nr:MAG: hypothetical protein GKR92_06935 [Gammaproteobacteria bacterium]
MNRYRRNIIFTIASGLSFPCVAKYSHSIPQISPVSPSPVLNKIFQECCPNLSDAAFIGKQYLRLQPKESNESLLKSKLWGDIPYTKVEQAEPCIQAIIKNHIADCSETNMITLNGLVLSQTEIRLYALVFLQFG